MKDNKLINEEKKLKSGMLSFSNVKGQRSCQKEHHAMSIQGKREPAKGGKKPKNTCLATDCCWERVGGSLTADDFKGKRGPTKYSSNAFTTSSVETSSGSIIKLCTPGSKK